MNFGEKLKYLRKEKKLNQAELAEELGVHLNTINRWEGLRDPIDDLTKLANLSHVLGTTVAYLRGESENPYGDPIQLKVGEYFEAKPKFEKFGNGHVFYYECNGQKVEIPAEKEFINLFLQTTREMRNVTTASSSVNKAQAYDNGRAVAVGDLVGV